MSKIVPDIPAVAVFYGTTNVTKMLKIKRRILWRIQSSGLGSMFLQRFQHWVCYMLFSKQVGIEDE